MRAALPQETHQEVVPEKTDLNTEDLQAQEKHSQQTDAQEKHPQQTAAQETNPLDWLDQLPKKVYCQDYAKKVQYGVEDSTIQNSAMHALTHWNAAITLSIFSPRTTKTKELNFTVQNFFTSDRANLNLPNLKTPNFLENLQCKIVSLETLCKACIKWFNANREEGQYSHRTSAVQAIYAFAVTYLALISRVMSSYKTLSIVLLENTTFYQTLSERNRKKLTSLISTNWQPQAIESYIKEVLKQFTSTITFENAHNQLGQTSFTLLRGNPRTRVFVDSSSINVMKITRSDTDQEARCLQSFNHPHIVPCLGYEHLPEKRLLIIFMLFRGESLSSIIRVFEPKAPKFKKFIKHPIIELFLQLPLRLSLILQLIEALSYLLMEQKHWLSDIKPCNLTVRREKNNLLLTVIDCGETTRSDGSPLVTPPYAEQKFYWNHVRNSPASYDQNALYIVTLIFLEVFYGCQLEVLFQLKTQESLAFWPAWMEMIQRFIEYNNIRKTSIWRYQKKKPTHSEGYDFLMKAVRQTFYTSTGPLYLSKSAETKQGPESHFSELTQKLTEAITYSLKGPATLTS